MATAGSMVTPPTGAKEIKKGAQRLSIEKLQEYESWAYGMFIHFGMSTYVGKNIPVPESDKYTLHFQRSFDSRRAFHFATT